MPQFDVIIVGTGPADVLGRLAKGIASLDKQTKHLLLEEASAQSARIATRLETAGAPKKLVQKVVRLFEMDGAVGLADHLWHRCERSVEPGQYLRRFHLR